MNPTFIDALARLRAVISAIVHCRETIGVESNKYVETVLEGAETDLVAAVESLEAENAT